VLDAVNVEVPGGRLLVPDLVIADAAVAAGDPVRYPATAVFAVIEIASPSTELWDRKVKPAMYAEAGISVYWRVDLEAGPQILVYGLRGGHYATRARLLAGTRGRVRGPFPVDVDPGSLRRRR
jgi:Uma2 family endonuclease